MAKLNESVQVFKGKFVDDTTFIGPDGKPYKLIPSVLGNTELSDEDKQKIQELSDEDSQPEQSMDWEGETVTKQGKLVVDIQTPDPSKTFIDDETGIAYKWDEQSESFVEVSGGDE